MTNVKNKVAAVTSSGSLDCAVFVGAGDCLVLAIVGGGGDGGG